MTRKKKEGSILLSPEHGVNPSVCCCEVCGTEYGVALLGKLKGDKEAPRRIFHGLCEKCEGVVKQGGALIIEVKDGETGKDPYRTGRLIGVGEAGKRRLNLEGSIGYMCHSDFDKLFGEYLKNQPQA